MCSERTQNHRHLISMAFSKFSFALSNLFKEFAKMESGPMKSDAYAQNCLKALKYMNNVYASKHLSGTHIKTWWQFSKFSCTINMMQLKNFFGKQLKFLINTNKGKFAYQKASVCTVKKYSGYAVFSWVLSLVKCRHCRVWRNFITWFPNLTKHVWQL